MTERFFALPHETKAQYPLGKDDTFVPEPGIDALFSRKELPAN